MIKLEFNGDVQNCIPKPVGHGCIGDCDHHNPWHQDEEETDNAEVVLHGRHQQETYPDPTTVYPLRPPQNSIVMAPTVEWIIGIKVLFTWTPTCIHP